VKQYDDGKNYTCFFGGSSLNETQNSFSATDFLKHVDIFSLLSDDEVSLIEKRLKPVRILHDEVLFREGDEGSELFIVRSGRVAIFIALPNGTQSMLREFSAGEFFGEMSIFENEPRSATCVARETSMLYALHERDFFKLIDMSPTTAIKIMYRMSRITTERLKNTSEFLTDLVRWGEKARKRAITDELTGVFNRHFLEKSIENLFASAKKRKKPLSMIMVDLDNFRTINEQYGHETGDRVILAVVDVFRQHLRKRDIMARYGGDEFTVVLPQTGLKEAETIAWKICREVRKLTVLKELDGPIDMITTSQGIAVYPENTEDLKELREKADRALYRSKENGRNRVSIAES
jgi:diguanylate cyclase (GGDEF)-like protein